MEVEIPHTRQFCASIDEMTGSIFSVREAVKLLREQSTVLDTKDGISLLSLKHHLLISYLQSLLLVSSRRALGHSLDIRSLPSRPFSTPDRDARGREAGDLVDSMVEGRVVLEKIKALEGRMRYQIEKLVRVADGPERRQNFIDDPLAFRPNPQNLMDNDQNGASGDEDVSHKHGYRDDSFDPSAMDSIYRPPRLAPMPYNEKSKSQSRKDRAPVPSALASLIHTASDPSRPHMESTSGLGSTPSLASGRATYLKRLTEFEEENFSRVMMKKSDAKRRARDEEDLALGGGLGGGGGRNRRRAGGLEDEFGDVLRSVGRGSAGGAGGGRGDGYEELRKKGKRADVLERSRTRSEGVRSREDAFGGGEESEGSGKMRKRSRFEVERKTAKKKLK